MDLLHRHRIRADRITEILETVNAHEQTTYDLLALANGTHPTNGRNVWTDVIERLPEYCETLTDEADPTYSGDQFVLTDRTVIEMVNGSDGGRWQTAKHRHPR